MSILVIVAYGVLCYVLGVIGHASGNKRRLAKFHDQVHDQVSKEVREEVHSKYVMIEGQPDVVIIISAQEIEPATATSPAKMSMDTDVWFKEDSKVPQFRVERMLANEFNAVQVEEN